MAEPESILIYEKREPHTAIIRLNRPEKKNSISRDLYWALDGAWQKAKEDDNVWTVILTGTADTFCVGGDLKENLAFAKGEMKGPRFGPRQYGNLRALQMHKPIIAAINGYAVGGGFNLALACNIRCCVPAAKFGCSEVRWSHMAAWPNYVCQLFTGWAYWFALTGQMVDAETAFRLGRRQDRGGFYGIPADLWLSFVTQECARLRVQLGGANLSLRPADDDRVPMACGDGTQCTAMPGPARRKRLTKHEP